MLTVVERFADGLRCTPGSGVEGGLALSGQSFRALFLTYIRFPPPSDRARLPDGAPRCSVTGRNWSSRPWGRPGSAVFGLHNIKLPGKLFLGGAGIGEREGLAPPGWNLVTPLWLLDFILIRPNTEELTS